MADPETSTESREDRLIARHFRPLARSAGAFGLTDDAAILSPPPGSDVVLTTDAIVAGVHFFPDDPADAVGRKALRVNLSDLAGKGAEPAGFLMSLALPDGIDDAWLGGFVRGLGADAEQYRCPLLGGDTDHTPGLLSVTITALGLVPQGTMLRRSGAKPDDLVFVTGTIGDAALGLRLRREPQSAAGLRLNPGERDHLLGRYLLPQPRMGLGDILRRYASAGMDVSDGLAGDLAKLCRVSGVSADIDVGQVPLSGPAQVMLSAEPELNEVVLTGGDDYEILCTIPEAGAARFRVACAGVGATVTQIGRIVAGHAAPRFAAADGTTLTFARPGFSHF